MGMPTVILILAQMKPQSREGKTLKIVDVDRQTHEAVTSMHTSAWVDETRNESVSRRFSKGTAQYNMLQHITINLTVHEFENSDCSSLYDTE
jgi:hypothetical protein